MFVLRFHSLLVIHYNLFLLLEEPLQFYHVERQRLIVADTHCIKQKISVLLRKPLLKHFKRVLRNDIEVDVAKRHWARAVLRGNLTLDLDRPDLQRENLLKASAPAT